MAGHDIDDQVAGRRPVDTDGVGGAFAFNHIGGAADRQRTDHLRHSVIGIVANAAVEVEGHRGLGRAELERQRIHALGNAKQPDEAVAFAACPASQAGCGGFEGIVDVTALLQRLHDAVDGGITHGGLLRRRAGGIGELGGDRHGFVGQHLKQLAVAGGQLDTTTVAGDDHLAFVQRIAGLEGTQHALGIAGIGFASDCHNGSNGLIDRHLSSPWGRRHAGRH